CTPESDLTLAARNRGHARESCLAESALSVRHRDRKSCFLIAPDDDAIVVARSVFMIDGLKVTVTGEELQKLLERRAEVHRQRAERWQHESERTPEQQT